LFHPEFEEKLIKREGDKTFTRNKWGGLEIQQDNSVFMPLTIEGVVNDRKSWECVRDRLCGDVSVRFYKNLDIICEEAEQSGLPIYTGDLPAGFFGAPREMLGLENLLYLFFDDPGLMDEILNTLCDLWIKMIEYLQQKIKLDYYFIWEDMCGKTGPLISPEMFKEFLLPVYKRLTTALRKGCNHVMADSDGDVRGLVPLWLEGGDRLREVIYRYPPVFK